MRRFTLILLMPLAACASVEERTDARSGSGFSSATITGAQGPGPVTTDATMRGFDPVPLVAVRGGATTVDAAAKVALAAGGSSSGQWTPVTAGGAGYALRQVQADGFNFAVAEPQGNGGASAALQSQIAIRTGCLTTGRVWEGDGRMAYGLDCS